MNAREKTSFLSRVLQALDCCSTVALLWALTRLYSLPWLEPYAILAVISFSASWVSFAACDLYTSWRGRQYYRELLAILKGWGIVAALVLFYFFLFKVSHQYSRFVVFAWFSGTPWLVFAVHVLGRRLLQALRVRGRDIKHAVIVGTDELGLRLERYIESIPWTGIRVEGFFDDRVLPPEWGGAPLLGRVRDLKGFLESNPVDYVYIALPMKAEEKIVYILNNCRTLGAELCLVPNFHAYQLLNAEIRTLGDLVVLNFNPNPRWKRAFDIAFSLAALLATLPLTLLVALLIRLQDGGPVFYAHNRVTAAGKPFKCLKFRTMQVDADRRFEEILRKCPDLRKEWGSSFKLKRDPRVTPLGRFLRRASLDELPQFWNVLKGDMSVVGARPVVEAELCHYYGKNGGLYCSIKPGITGPWQVGERSDAEDYGKRVELDTWYVLNHSFWLDVKIIVKTVGCIVRGNGAY